MSETNRLIIATAMRAMYERGHVDICTVNECIKLAGIIPHGPALGQLHALHCVKFEVMPKELLDLIPGLLTEAFNGIDIESLMAATKPALSGNGVRKFLSRLQ